MSIEADNFDFNARRDVSTMVPSKRPYNCNVAATSNCRIKLGGIEVQSGTTLHSGEKMQEKKEEMKKEREKCEKLLKTYREAAKIVGEVL